MCKAEIKKEELTKIYERPSIRVKSATTDDLSHLYAGAIEVADRVAEEERDYFLHFEQGVIEPTDEEGDFLYFYLICLPFHLAQ